MTNQPHLHRMMVEATQFRMLLDVFRRDPQITPQSASLMRDIFMTGSGHGATKTLRKSHATY